MCAAARPAARLTAACMRTGETPQPRGAHAPPRKRPRGFTYLWLLFALALGSVALAALGEQELTRQRREREAELRFRGEAIAAALGRYAERTPVGRLPLPQQLDNLLDDRRFPQPQHHLRRLYADPFTGRADWEPIWGLAAPAAAPAAPGPARATADPPVRGIVGVRSASTRRLLASNGHATAHDWIFLAPTTAPAVPP